MMEILQDTHNWVAFSFLMFAVLFWLKGKDAVLRSLDNKIAVIRQDIESAESLRAEAQNLFASYERQHRDSVVEAEQIIATAAKQAEEFHKQARADLNETLRIREKNLEERIDRMKQAAREELQAYAADLAVQATAGLIAEKLDKKTAEGLIDKAIGEVGKNLN